MQRFHNNSDDLCKYMSDICSTVIVSFSAGKDSIAMWSFLRRYFKTIVPVYLYLHPDLEFVNESLAYYEKYFGTRIYRVPHPSLYAMINGFVFQPNYMVDMIVQNDLPNFHYDDIFGLIRTDYAVPDAYVAVGNRINDSLTRRAALKKYGPVNPTRMQFYPIYDWDNARLIKELEVNKITLPVDYLMFGRSFDGLAYKYLIPIIEHFPKDYERLKELYPCLDVEVVRYKLHQARSRVHSGKS